MLKNALQKIVGLKAQVETHAMLRMHAKEYRTVKNALMPTLIKHSLTPLKWMLIGVLHENTLGCRAAHLAAELTVEPPLITHLVAALKKSNLVKIRPDPQDGRAKIIHLSKKGHTLFLKVERELQGVIQTISPH